MRYVTACRRLTVIFSDNLLIHILLVIDMTCNRFSMTDCTKNSQKDCGCCHLLLYMRMCKKVILTVLIITVALGAIPEFQFRMLKLCPAAYGASVLRSARVSVTLVLCLPYILLELMLAPDLLRRIRLHISGAKEKDQEI